jgi:hypothetical protein
MRASAHALALAALLAGYTVVSCITHEIPSGNGSSGDDDDDDGGEETLADLPACPYSTSTVSTASDDDGGALAALTYGRVYLNCDVGVGEEACISNDPTICPDHGASVGGTTIQCINQCDESQYAIGVALGITTDEAGTVYTPVAPTLPESCEIVSEDIGGGSVYCCDCPGN